MPSVALNVGANRIVAGSAITAPLGAPAKEADAERRFRREVVLQALELLAREIDSQTLVQRAS